MPVGSTGLTEDNVSTSTAGPSRPLDHDAMSVASNDTRASSDTTVSAFYGPHSNMRAQRDVKDEDIRDAKVKGTVSLAIRFHGEEDKIQVMDDICRWEGKIKEEPQFEGIVVCDAKATGRDGKRRIEVELQGSKERARELKKWLEAKGYFGERKNRMIYTLERTDTNEKLVVVEGPLSSQNNEVGIVTIFWRNEAGEEFDVEDIRRMPGFERQLPQQTGGDDWIQNHMPEWLLQAIEKWPSKWHDDQEIAYQNDKEQWNVLRNEMRQRGYNAGTVTEKSYIDVKLKPADNNGFLAAVVVIVSQGRALMLLDRNRSENGGEILLGCTGGRRAYIDESAWDCARRMVSAETGGLAELPPEIPSAVAWHNAKCMIHDPDKKYTTTKPWWHPQVAVFVYYTADDQLAERIQDLRRPPNVKVPKGAPGNES
jgi:hypothetical protein